MFLRRKVPWLIVVFILVFLTLIGCGGSKEFTITIEKEGNGKVTMTPEQVSYKKGTTVTLTAEPDTGWKFDKWQGGASGANNPLTITVDSNITILAIFSALQPTNTAPKLESIGNKSVLVGHELNFTINAIDQESNTLTYSITDKPASAIFNPDTHTFNWTPTEADMGTHTVTFSVTDGKLSDAETITITVSKNEAPILAPIGNKIGKVGQTLTFTISASDPNGQQLNYSVTDLPQGAVFDAEKHEFSWTLASSAVGVHIVTFNVSDGELSDSETINITVDANNAPVLDPIGSKYAMVNNQLTFMITGSDPDGDDLSYSIANPPTGSTFDIETLTFDWTPSANDVGVHTVTFSVFDGAIVVSETINITVIEGAMVPAHYLTIQEAINAVSDGDVIIVSPGTYKENINFKGKAITVQSIDPTNAAVRDMTIIDGQLLGPVVTFENGEGNGSVLTGFTIQNGKIHYEPMGAGISIIAASPTITHNKVINNQGSGIMAHTSCAVIEHNIVKYNVAERGAGIHIVRESNARVNYNDVAYNESTKYGGGICIDSNSYAIVNENIVSMNKAGEVGGGIAAVFNSGISAEVNFVTNNSSRYGGGFGAENSRAFLKGNFFGWNTVSYFGGGVSIVGGEYQTLNNNTIEDNKATIGAGGVLISTTFGEFLNNIVARNIAELSGAGGVLIELSTIEVLTNLIDANKTIENGGGIKISFNSIVTLHGNTISNHEVGSGVYVSTTCTIKRLDGSTWPVIDITDGEPTNTYANNSPCHVDFN